MEEEIIKAKEILQAIKEDRVDEFLINTDYYDIPILERVGILINLYSDPRYAKKIFERILYLDPDNLSAKYSLGFAYFRLEDWDNALFYFQEVLKKDPTNSPCWQEIGIVQMKIGNYDKAIESLIKRLNIPLLMSFPIFYYPRFILN